MPCSSSMHCGHRSISSTPCASRRSQAAASLHDTKVAPRNPVQARFQLRIGAGQALSSARGRSAPAPPRTSHRRPIHDGEVGTASACGGSAPSGSARTTARPGSGCELHPRPSRVQRMDPVGASLGFRRSTQRAGPSARNAPSTTRPGWSRNSGQRRAPSTSSTSPSSIGRSPIRRTASSRHGPRSTRPPSASTRPVGASAPCATMLRVPVMPPSSSSACTRRMIAQIDARASGPSMPPEEPQCAASSCRVTWPSKMRRSRPDRRG